MKLSSKLLLPYRNISHNFGTRKNGLTIEEARAPNHLEKCRQLAAKNNKMDLENVACLEQVHSNRVKIANESGIYPATDGVITNKKELLLCIQTADCAPIFLFAPQKKVIGALHGGWRGIARNIIRVAIDRLKSTFEIEPYNLLAAVGPSLRNHCFEIGPDILHHFDDRFILEEDDQYYLSFAELIKYELIEAGLIKDNIDILDYCTKCDPHMFYSYRGDNQVTGRMLNTIKLLDR